MHVDRDEETCKFRLVSVALVRNPGFSAKELRKVQRLVADNRQGLLEAWHEYFSE